MRVVINHRNVKRLSSPEFSAGLVKGYADRIAGRARDELRQAPSKYGSGASSEHYPGFDVGTGTTKQGDARANVFARSQYAKNHDRKHNTLLKALADERMA